MKLFRSALAVILASCAVVASAAEPTTIAVLPFADESPDRTREYFSHGMSEELRKALSRVEGLQVAARDSSKTINERAGRDVGVSLKVGSVVEGSVRLVGNTLKVTARLINAVSGKPIWSRSFERDLEDVFALQDELSRAIVVALGVEAPSSQLVQPATQSIRAYDLYLVGRYHWHKRTPASLAHARDLFQQAIELDDQYALAYTGLADANLLLHGYGNLDAKQAYSNAAQAVDRALAIDAGLAEGHASLGLLKLEKGEYKKAEQAFARAIELNPNYSMAHMWKGLIDLKQGRLRVAHAEFERARELDPLHPTVNINYANTSMSLGRYEDGIQCLQGMLEAAPPSGAIYRALSGSARAFGKLGDAVRWGQKAVTLEPDSPTSVITLAWAYLGLADAVNARRWLRRAEELAPDNPESFEANAFLYLVAGDGEGLGRFTDQALPPAGRTEPNPYLTRKKLIWAAYAKAMIGDFHAAQQRLDRAEALMSVALPAMERMGFVAILASVHRQLGNTQHVQALVKEGHVLLREARTQGWKKPGLDYMEASLYAQQDRPKQALAALRRAMDGGWKEYAILRQDLRFGPLRDHPEFRSLVDRMKKDVARMRAAAPPPLS